jgi:hypothetical protein
MILRGEWGPHICDWPGLHPTSHRPCTSLRYVPFQNVVARACYEPGFALRNDRFVRYISLS